MARIAYVDHSYHKKTLSTLFLVDILRKHGHSVDLFWDESWINGRTVAFDQVRDYDVIIMFQCKCATKEPYYRKLHPNVIHIPMLDQFGIYRGPWSNTSPYWDVFQGSKVLSFSRYIHALVTALGIYSLPVRYYPTPLDVGEYSQKANKYIGLHGFFWLRHEEHVSWPLIRDLIGNTQFDSLHMHIAVDPEAPLPTLPTQIEIEKHNITMSTWFENKQDFWAVLEQANVFFAPRLEEGIGQSFLEAMNRGQCVVAADNGTMNEYIANDINGLLYNPTCPAPLDFSGVNTLGVAAHKSVHVGYQDWKKKEQSIVNFITTPSVELYKGLYQHVYLQNSLPSCSVKTSIKAYIRNLRLLRSTERYWLPIWQKLKVQKGGK